MIKQTLPAVLAAVVVSILTAATAQAQTIAPNGHGRWPMWRNAASPGDCLSLEVPGGSDGTTVIPQPCDPGNLNQRWNYIPVFGHEGTYYLDAYGNCAWVNLQVAGRYIMASSHACDGGSGREPHDAEWSIAAGDATTGFVFRSNAAPGCMAEELQPGAPYFGHIYRNPQCDVSDPRLHWIPFGN